MKEQMPPLFGSASGTEPAGDLTEAREAFGGAADGGVALTMPAEGDVMWRAEPGAMVQAGELLAQLVIDDNKVDLLAPVGGELGITLEDSHAPGGTQIARVTPSLED